MDKDKLEKVAAHECVFATIEEELIGFPDNKEQNSSSSSANDNSIH